MVRRLTTHQATPTRSQHTINVTAMFDPYPSLDDVNTIPSQEGQQFLQPSGDEHFPLIMAEAEADPQPQRLDAPTSTTHPSFNADHHCNICFKHFTITSSLLSHKQCAHDIPSPVALRLYSMECPICHSQPTTRSELIRHAAKPKCGLRILETIAPMTPAQFAVASPELYKRHT
eukprot:243174-Amphidinium_carterae.1